MHRRLSQFVIFLIIIQVLLVYLHFFIYDSVVVFFNIENETVMSILWAATLVLAFCFTVSSVLAFSRNNFFTQTFYKLACVWMGLFFYLFIASFFSWIGFDIRPSLAPALPAVLFAVAGAVTVGGLVSARRLKIISLTVPIADLPDVWEKRTVVFASDFHLGQIQSRGFAERIAGVIKDLKPDLVLVGGDIYDGVAVDAAGVVEPLSGLRPPQGVYFVTGNHDEFRDTEKYLRALKNIGFKVLMNESVEIDGLRLIGVDYRSTEKKSEYAGIMKSVGSPPKPTILLRHVPDFLEVAEAAGISLQLSGHTHYGQVFPITLLTRWLFKKFSYGFHARGGLKVYTSSGVGTWGPPLRLGTQAEIVKIKLTGGEAG